MNNEQLIKEVLKTMLYSTEITGRCAEDITKYLETGDFNSFSSESKKELSALYKPVFLPYCLGRKDIGGYVPNIFAELE